MLNWIVWNRTICIKMELVLNNLQRLICHNNQTIGTLSNWYHNAIPFGCVCNSFFIECIIIHGTHMTANILIIMLCSFLFQIENSITTINPWSQCHGQEEKIFCITIYLETKIIQNSQNRCNPLIQLWFIIDKKVKNRLHVLEADIITIKKKTTLIWCL